MDIQISSVSFILLSVDFNSAYTVTYVGKRGYVPCVVVSVVYSDSVAKAGKRSVQLLCQNKLMTQQSVGVRKAWVHLRDRQVQRGSERDRSETDRQVMTCLILARRLDDISHSNLGDYGKGNQQ